MPGAVIWPLPGLPQYTDLNPLVTGAVSVLLSIFFTFFPGFKTTLGELLYIAILLGKSPSPLIFHIFIDLTFWHRYTPLFDYGTVHRLADGHLKVTGVK